MRTKITDLNDPNPNGVVILPGALKLPENGVPVRLKDASGPVVGMITDLDEDDKAVYGEIQFFDSALDYGLLGESSENLVGSTEVHKLYINRLDEGLIQIADGILRGYNIQYKDGVLDKE